MKVKYRCIDEDNNTWQCTNCGYIVSLEADGPYENGWDRCPSCGEEIDHPEDDDDEQHP